METRAVKLQKKLALAHEVLTWNRLELFCQPVHQNSFNSTGKVTQQSKTKKLFIGKAELCHKLLEIRKYVVDSAQYDLVGLE